MSLRVTNLSQGPMLNMHCWRAQTWSKHTTYVIMGTRWNAEKHAEYIDMNVCHTLMYGLTDTGMHILVY